MEKITGKILCLGLIAVMLAAFSGLPAVKVVNAAALTSQSDTMSTLAPSVVANHDISFVTPTGVTAGQTVTLTFPTGFAMGSVAYGDMDFRDNGTDVALAATAAGAVWGAAKSGQVITFTSGTGTITAGHTIRILIGTNASYGGAGVNQITNPTTGSYSITIGGTMADSGSITVSIASNTVAVSGTVGQTISFSLGASSVALGTLSTSTATTGTHTMNVSTNGTSGMTVTVAGSTLTSGANTIAACATGCSSTTSTAQFGINLVANTTPSVGANPSGSAPIGSAATNYNTGNTFRFATGETVASSTGAINNTTYTISYLANIAGTTPAGSYTTTLTYVATANF